MILFLVMLVSVGVSMGAVPQEPANRCPSWGSPIHVHIHGIRKAQGTVKAVLYGPDPKTFLVKGKNSAGALGLLLARSTVMPKCSSSIPSQVKFILCRFLMAN